MGAKFAPSVANLFMAKWESEEIFQNRPQALALYKRYIDNIIIVWTGSSVGLESFLSQLNNNVYGIKFTSTYSETEVHFLDLVVFVEGGKLCTKTFFKETDRNSYIPTNSCHHPKWKVNIPKGQLLRVRRNCTKIEDYRAQSSSMVKKFIDKGYSSNKLVKLQKEIEVLDRNAILSDKPATSKYEDKFATAFLTTYSKEYKLLEESIRKHWPILLQDNKLKDILPARPNFIYMKAPNLRNQLVKNVSSELSTSYDVDGSDWLKSCCQVDQITRTSVRVNIKVVIIVVDLIIPEIKVSPHSLKITEGKNDLTLVCNTQISLPLNALLTWKKNNEFLGSFFHGTTNVVHRGIFGNLDWTNHEFIYRQNSPSLNDSGIYECCISLDNHTKKCDNARIIVISPEKTQCTNNKFIPASPFQINHFQSRHLLREGHFVIILWKFNISEWKISSRFPQCQGHLVNMELGVERWFGTNVRRINRNKRGIVEGILGGFGTIGSLTNSMDITTLKSDLETAGLMGSKSINVQRNLNQILENMVMKTATVTGPSIIHLQDATLNLMNSDQQSHIARACLEIQTEYSTNFKIIAQAFQSGITPLGILQNVPSEYGFALNHTDLWVNKWIGCHKDDCYGTSMVPIAGKEHLLVPITVLGLPVSDTQLLYYQLQHTDFAMSKSNTELDQLDLSSCLHFQSKIICLPNQDKSIYHSCFHNHTLCTARIEQVKTKSDLITLVGQSKSWWSKIKNAATVWGKTSVTSAAGNILLHPIVIIFIIIILCILFQICLMFRMKRFYSLIRIEMKKGFLHPSGLRSKHSVIKMHHYNKQAAYHIMPINNTGNKAK
ncbi:uncharacterized protein ACMZJ9_012885 [Mantella aurantiaca]